jgi:hypothetical protein
LRFTANEFFFFRFYNSFLDDPRSIDQELLNRTLTNLTNAILKFMFEWVSDGTKIPKGWEVNTNVLEILMDCFWKWPNWKCDLFDRINASTGGKLDDGSPYKRSYTRPPRSYHYDNIIYYANDPMAYFLGDRLLMPNETGSCEKSSFTNNTGSLYVYEKMFDLLNASNLSYCIVHSVRLTEAKSPAFEIGGYDFRSGEYSTWVESKRGVRTETGIRVFLYSDPVWGGCLLFMGIIVTVVVYFIASGSDILFSTNVPAK